jgi:hypothetical protein
MITQLLLAPFMAPVWGFRFLIEQLHDEADAVLRDEGRAFAELVNLSMRRNTGELSEDEYAEQETALLDRLSSIRDYRNELLAQADENEDDWEYDESDEDEYEDDAQYAESDVDDDVGEDDQDDPSIYAELDEGEENR